ncbi:phage integrase SAM-like domain and Arm DNA-binding domain-containing protein [Albibacterium profundi]|uniref:Phage integrase SAM-like domain and Arm DNA-binding domain-containing protein n=1 Tax=Albibacterium profundi TaxID=3134906 RepID=A0ABV5CB58_9SPHI
MRSTNTSGIHFVLRMSRGKNGKAAIYVRIVVDKGRSEIALKRLIDIADWNKVKGMAKPKNVELKALNSYLEETRGLLTSHYQEFIIKKQLVTADAVKNKYIGIVEQENTLQSLMEYHNLLMKEVLAYGTLKNYFTTVKYLKEFLLKQFKKSDIYLTELDYQFITQFEYFLRTYEPTDYHKGMANNGVMKHLERFRKMVF